MKRSDAEVETDVREALFWDGRVESREIAVSVHDGLVRLRGTVGSPRQKRVARDVASRVSGVVDVIDRLEVEPLDRSGRRDAELRAEVLDALHCDRLLPETIEVSVRFGNVTLNGRVYDMFEREEAERAAAAVRGVKDVRNELSVENRPVSERWLQ